MDSLEFVILAKDKFSNTFGKLTNMLPSVKTLAIGAGTGIAAAGTALIAMTKSTATAHDKIQKLSDQIGNSVEFLSRMQVAANFSGVAVETTNKSIQKLQVGIGDAGRGIGTAKEAFERLNLSIHDTNGNLLTSEQIMPELADKLHDISNATERAELASKLFGQRGIEMLQILNSGSAGLKKMTDEADRFGVTISAKAGANAAAFNDMLYRNQLAMTGLRNVIAEDVMPIMTGLGNRIANFVVNNRDEIIKFGIKFVEVMGQVAEKGAYAVAVLVDSWRGLRMLWEVLKIGFSEFERLYFVGLNELAEKYKSFLEVINVRGVFDNAIAETNAFATNTASAIDHLDKLSNSAWQNLNALAYEKTAISQVESFSQKVRETLAEIKAEGNVGASIAPTGIGIFSDANLAKTQANVAANMSSQIKAQEDLQALKEQYLMTETERIDEWYVEQLNKYQEDKEAQAIIDEIYDVRQRQARQKSDKNEQQLKERQSKALNLIAQQGGKAGFALSQAAAIPQALMSTYTAAIDAYKALSGIPLIGPALGIAAAAAATSYGMQQVASIRSQKYSVAGAAHGGIENIPRERTYLLDAGERVLSPNQNRDLTDYINRGDSSGIIVQQLIIEVMPNATHPGALLSMTKRDWQNIAEDRIIPALREIEATGFGI